MNGAGDDDAAEGAESSDPAISSLLAQVARIPARSLEREWKPPEELDEYRLIRPLGRGGMGSVWLAEDRLLDRLVAIKFILHTDLDARTRERFAIEARAAARLAHANVVTVHRFGELAGRPYLVSEYIRGDSLDKVAKPIGWQRGLELGIALARGLAAAHRHGIVHRDIKPANAILGADGDVKLVDFGLAKLGSNDHAVLAVGSAREDEVGVLTAAGAIAGTPLYLAPEVRKGEPADRRSDVYQLGCILYELLAGRAPLLELSKGAASALDEDVPSLMSRVAAEGARFAAVVDRCLRRDPSQRFGSGDELREALERIAAPMQGGELPEGNPYRGLVAFDAEHRALFFGRGAEIRAVIERLRAEPFVLVTGDSGVGKSSLCRAGVVPHVIAGALGDGLTWKAVQLVPGRRPMTALAMLLAPILELDEAATTALLRDEPGQLARELRRTLGPAQGVLLFIDQLEELTTLAVRDEVETFGRVVGSLASGAPGIRVLATVRSDFLTRLAEVPALGEELERALYVLRPLSADGAREAIVGPARAKGARFESEELIDTLVAAVAASAGGAAIELPLLAFTLAALWDARDTQSELISSRSLDAIGGVRGALARHADGVLDALLPAQRAAAKKVLLRLVTPERTRARRSLEELAVDRAVLDALVRGRLVVARGAEPPTFELAHERLLDGWPAFAGWLLESNEAIALHDRLATAVAAWERMSRGKEALWRDRQLADLDILPDQDLTAGERTFVTASRRAARRRRAIRILAAIAIPALIAAFFVGVRVVADRDVARHVANKVADARRELATARAASIDSARQRSDAFARFDAGDATQGEALWESSFPRDAEALAAYARASGALEAALLLDTKRTDVRRELAEVTTERIALAERDYKTAERAELIGRLAVYDDGTFMPRITGPGTLSVAIEPAGASVALTDDKGRPHPLVATTPLAPGAYVVTASASGRAKITAAMRITSGQESHLALSLPDQGAVPAGFIYVPAGSFLYGSREDESIRKWFATSPMHELKTDAFLIGRTEVTYAQWIEFLDALPSEQRALRTPRVGTSATVQEGGAVELTRSGKLWVLHMTPSKTAYEAPAGSPIEYADREHRRRQDWLQFPVSGVSPQDALAYAAWLDGTGRVPHARLCTEPEWEHAMRGADGRPFPHGDQLSPDDANIDVTYGQREGGFGPDVVGAHPASTSPFGLVDGSGNVWEIVKTSTGFGTRGGGFYTGVYVAHLANRQEGIPDTYRHLHAGLRICADPPISRGP